MRVGKWLLFSIFVLCLFGYRRTPGESDEGTQRRWITPGAEWFVHVRQYERGWAVQSSNPQVSEEAQTPKVQCEFGMRVIVLEPRGEGDEQVARIQFSPLNDAPNFMRGTIRVLELYANTGKAKAIKERIDDEGSGVESVASIGQEKILLTQMYGFPVDWIVSISDVALRPPREEDLSVINRAGPSLIKKLRPFGALDEGHQAVEVEAGTSWPVTGPTTKVVQTWVPGEAWWRNYKRYIQGHLDLEAALVERRDGKKE